MPKWIKMLLLGSFSWVSIQISPGYCCHLPAAKELAASLLRASTGPSKSSCAQQQHHPNGEWVCFKMIEVVSEWLWSIVMLDFLYEWFTNGYHWGTMRFLFAVNLSMMAAQQFLLIPWGRRTQTVSLESSIVHIYLTKLEGNKQKSCFMLLPSTRKNTLPYHRGKGFGFQMQSFPWRWTYDFPFEMLLAITMS